MEQYVVSSDLAEKLEAAGYPQNSFNVYEQTDGIPKGKWYLTQPELMRRYGLWTTQEVKEHIAAPLSDELLEQLPNVIVKDEETYYLLIQNPFTTDRRAHYHTVGAGGTGRLRVSTNDDAIGVAKKQCDALAKLWLWCKENGYLKNT